MTAYFIAQINIFDHKKYNQYLDGYNEIFDRYKGQVIAVDDDTTVLEGEWAYKRTVIIKFPTENDLQAWYMSPEYQELAEYRRQASDANIIMIHGRR
ncbi:MAG: DUF1330 domain-containing protein [Deltaproteobacteria bacterium]|nr:DUF1330 domain-containing protein [Deltaproteobacteria bacterium]